MIFYITCPACGNRFPAKIGSTADGHRICAECGECIASIEIEMKNGIPRVAVLESFRWEEERE